MAAAMPSVTRTNSTPPLDTGGGGWGITKCGTAYGVSSQPPDSSPVPYAPRPMTMAPVVATSSSITGRLTSDGLKYQSYRPTSAPPGPPTNPSSETAMSKMTLAMITPFSGRSMAVEWGPT